METLEEYIENSYNTKIDFDKLVDDIQFNIEGVMGIYMKRCELAVAVIPLDRLYAILATNIPGFANYLKTIEDGTDTNT